MPDCEPIAFEAEVRQVRSMVDGSINILLNVPEQYREEAKRFLDWHKMIVALSAVAIGKEEEYGGKPKKIHF